MTISGRQKHSLEAAMHSILWDFAKTVGLSNEYMVKQIIGKVMGNRIQDIISAFKEVPDNNGRLGNLRGWINKRRNTIIDHYESSGTVYHQDLLDLLSEIKGQSKLLMNGENILLGHKICNYVDLEEKVKVLVSPLVTKEIPFYCGKEINYGFDYCKDHQVIIDAKKAIEKAKEEEKSKGFFWKPLKFSTEVIDQLGFDED